MTIVIVPATSRTNTYVINALLSFPRPPSIRLVAHSNDARMHLQEKFMNRPNVSTAVADLLDPSTLRNALKGARIVFYNGPVRENESQMGKKYRRCGLCDGYREVGLLQRTTSIYF